MQMPLPSTETSSPLSGLVKCTVATLSRLAYRGRSTQQLRQPGEVHRHPPRLVARQPISSPSGATQRYVRNRGKAEVCGLCRTRHDGVIGAEGHSEGGSGTAQQRSDGPRRFAQLSRCHAARSATGVARGRQASGASATVTVCKAVRNVLHGTTVLIADVADRAAWHRDSCANLLRPSLLYWAVPLPPSP